MSKEYTEGYRDGFKDGFEAGSQSDEILVTKKTNVDYGAEDMKELKKLSNEREKDNHSKVKALMDKDYAKDKQGVTK